MSPSTITFVIPVAEDDIYDGPMPRPTSQHEGVETGIVGGATILDLSFVNSRKRSHCVTRYDL